MTRNLSRLLPLVRWHYLRWGLVIPALPLALWACNSHKLQQPLPNPQQETDFAVLVSPERAVDILFMVDNSPSMDPKQAALATNFPRLIQALQTLPGGLPDVHIGVISSDMGAGSEGIGGNCDVPLGDRGLLWGNDPTPGVRATVAGAPNNGCGLNSGARWIEDIQNPNGVGRQQNYTGNLTDVFSCLAKAVGVNGCGYEHPLQSVRVALNPQGGINDANVGFVRPKGYLAIVLITDEDDCSADVSDVSNNGMFLQRPKGETASMKCATRGDLCNGAEIPNYDVTNGFPTTGFTGFSTPLSNCAPRDQRTPADPAYMPLIPVQAIIDSVNSVHVNTSGVDVYKRPEQILVSGIIGWPANNDPSTVNFTIGVDTTSLPPPQNTYWDYMPICTIPSQKSADGNIYRAYGGLRLKKFIDAYKRDDPNTFSICNSDFTSAMTQIGNAIVKVLKPGCVNYPLIDTDPNWPGVQPECQVLDRISCDTPNVGNCLSSGYEEKSLLECMDGAHPLDATTPNLNAIPDSARPCWYLTYDKTAAGCATAPDGQRILALRRSGTVAPAGTLLAMKCLTCAKPAGQTCPVVGTH
jgi:hypothetical protein